MPKKSGSYPRIKEIKRMATRYKDAPGALRAYRTSIDHGQSHAEAKVAAILAGGGPK